ncbi:MAG: branched-chain amino acid ABC transporter permease [Chloroflexi bacterium]|nr:branched-chain amino acid ABC transporter permease [Chloroflexota bacterium]
MDPRLFAQAVVGSVLNGGVYGIVALGLALIFGVMRIINFAHGTFMMLAMYLSFWAFTLAGVDPYLSVVLTVPTLFVIGVLVQRYLINYVLGAPEHTQLLLTLGVALIVQNAALALWTPDPRSISTVYTRTVWYVTDVAISLPRLIAFAAAVVASLLLFLLLTRTDLGKAMRTAAEEPESVAWAPRGAARVDDAGHRL